MLARCPSCRQTFSTDRAGQQECPHCHKPLIVPSAPTAELMPPASFGSPSPEAPDDAPGTPWEQRDRLGLFTAWTRTVSQALFEPGKLYGSARLDRGPAQLGFAVLTWSVFSAFGQILDRLVLSAQRDQARRWIENLRSSGSHLPPLFEKLLGMGMADESLTSTLGIALLAPIIALLLVYVNAGVTHAAAMVLGHARRGFAATFAACAYGFAPFVLLAVPGCGGIVAVIWCAALTGVGLKRTHRITPGAAASAVLAPYLLVCLAGCLLSVFAAATLRGLQPPQ